MHTTPPNPFTVAADAGPGTFLKSVRWLTAASSLLALGYGATYKLQISPLEKINADLRVDAVGSQSRLDRAEADYKALSVSMADTRLKALGLQVNADGKTQMAEKCVGQLAQYQRSYTMSSHLIELRKQRISAERGFAFTSNPALKASYEHDISNLQKQIEFATKCS